MLKIYFICSLLSVPFFIQAQVLDPSIINTAGGKIDIASRTNQANNNWMLDWSLGEPFAIQNGVRRIKLFFL